MSENSYLPAAPSDSTVFLLFAALLGTVLAASPASAVNDVAGELVLFNTNGAWSWFEDERAVVDIAAGKIVVSSVADESGTGGAARQGDVDVASLDLASGIVTNFTLHDNFQDDDHDSAALWIRPDGRYLAMYSKHSSDNFTQYRISSNPGDVSSWGPVQTFDNGAATTYSNLHYLSNDNGGAGRLYNLTRTVGWDPNLLVSNDFGSNWSYGGRLLAEGTSSDRPYVRYFSNGDKIHFITTERHPRNFDNSIYHGYIKDGQLFRSNGSVLDANLLDASAVAPASLTPIFTTGTVVGGTPMNRAWTVDVAIDDAGLPSAVFQTRANGNTLDHRFFYAKFNGANWAVHELAKAGGFLYAAENEYTGLVALDPSEPNRLFMSTNVDPRTEVGMAHYEIFEGITADGGANWSWTPITFNSLVDNLRPIVPKWDEDNTALLWMRGSYTTYRDYKLDVVGLTAFSPLAESPLGDLNGDGDIDVDDFAEYLSGLHADLSGLTAEAAYRKGDLNGDFANNYADFLLFKGAYNMVHGAGAFELALQAPEPGMLGMFSIAIGFIAGVVRRRRLCCGLMLLACVTQVSPSYAVPLFAIDINDRTEGEAGQAINTPAGFTPVTLSGSGPVAGTTVSAGGLTLTFTAVNAAGVPTGQLDDRDRATPMNTPPLAQIYDDLMFAGTTTGTGGGIDLTINSNGLLAANSPYSISLYSYDSGSAGATPRTADWRDGNNFSSFVVATSHVGANLPTADELYKFTGAAQTDGSGNLFLRGRNTTSSGAIGVILNGFEINPFVPPVEMTLEVNTTTGVVRLVNEQSVSFDMSYYEIRSSSGSLDLAGWTSLDDAEGGDPLGAGWDEGPNGTSSLLTEVNVSSLTTFEAGSSASLGQAFAVGSPPDVQFYYGGPNDPTLRTGFVKFIQGTVIGDYNRNGTVDAADYALWRNTFGQTGAGLAADGNGNNQIDSGDYGLWQAHFGQVFGSGGTQLVSQSFAAVPEPTTALFFLTAAASVFGTNLGIRTPR